MQLQFEKQVISCLQTVKRELQSQEQTQEVRVSDGMPDIGSIIGSWGQVILRGKEWQGDGMTVSGGTMTWTLYQPEGGGVPQLVESWLPFQFRWSLPQTQQDGTIFACPVLCSVDARTLSSRKMMLRTNVSVWGWAMEKQEQEICLPGEYPSDIQLLRERYPMELPVEAGEKAFALEETLNLPPTVPPMEKAVYYSLNPEITEEKLMGDKVVFRGNAVFHLCYCGEDGGRYACDFDLQRIYAYRNKLDMARLGGVVYCFDFQVAVLERYFEGLGVVFKVLDRKKVEEKLEVSPGLGW